MRERSETIYASSEEEFKEVMQIRDRRNSSRKDRRERKISINQDSFSEKEFEEMEESFKTYKMTVIEPTIEEREKSDESKLLEAINEMNQNYKDYCNKNKRLKENYDPNINLEDEYENLKENSKHPLKNSGNKRSMSYCVSQNHDDSSNIIKINTLSKSFINQNEDFKQNTDSPEFNEFGKNLSTVSNTLSLGKSDVQNMEAFVSQNLINFDEILKLIVIGDKGTGKSLFINKFTEENDLNNQENFSKYTPTESLEIKKTFRQVGDKNIKIELWDTNLSVLTSPIIKTYYKISNGFVIIADYEKIESFSFLEKQIENIFNFSNFHNNILFIVNKKENFGQSISKEHLNKVETKLKNISEKFNISPIYYDLSKLYKNNEALKNFMLKIYLKKNGINFELKIKNKLFSKKTLKRQNENSSYNININNNNIINNNKNDNESNFNILKRTRSVNRKLSQALDKLSTENTEEE